MITCRGCVHKLSKDMLLLYEARPGEWVGPLCIYCRKPNPLNMTQEEIREAVKQEQEKIRAYYEEKTGNVKVRKYTKRR